MPIYIQAYGFNSRSGHSISLDGNYQDSHLSYFLFLLKDIYVCRQSLFSLVRLINTALLDSLFAFFIKMTRA